MNPNSSEGFRGKSNKQTPEATENRSQPTHVTGKWDTERTRQKLLPPSMVMRQRQDGTGRAEGESEGTETDSSV